jgi:hypothetical protein
MPGVCLNGTGFRNGLTLLRRQALAVPAEQNTQPAVNPLG